jgi:Ca-activated chloride channel family protein
VENARVAFIGAARPGTGVISPDGYSRLVPRLSASARAFFRRRASQLGEPEPAVHSTLPMISVALVLTVCVALLFGTLRHGPEAAGGQCPAGDLQVVADPAIASLLSDLAVRYAHGPGAGCAPIRVTARASARVVSEFARGWHTATDGPRPQVWIPTSSVWSRMLAVRAAGKELPARSGPPIAYSPLVIALPAPMADALGWSNRSPRWRDVLDTLADPRGWATHGHPEWGPVTLAVADPAQSAEGLAAVVAMVGTLRGLNQEDYLPASTVADSDLFTRLVALRQATTRTAPDTMTLLTASRTASSTRPGATDPAATHHAASMFLVSEQDVWRYNTAGPAVRLTAVYPADGSPVAEYPYLLVGRDAMSTPERIAAAGFVRYLRSAEVRDRLVSQAFRRALCAEGAPFTTKAGLRSAPARVLLPATGGATLAGLAQEWNTAGKVRS